MHFISKQTKSFIKNTLSITVLAGIIAGCSNSDFTEPWEGEPSLITLQSAIVEAKTRTQDTQIVSGEKVSFFVTKASDVNTEIYKNVEIVADNNGGFTYSTPMYYPADNTRVDFYAVHPYLEGVSSIAEVWADFAIKADQRQITNFLASDLLHASNTGIARTKEKVSMTFTHKLSKINFTIIPGNGMSLTDLSAVEIMNIQPSTGINITSGEIKAASGDVVNVQATGVAPAADENASVAGIEAIIVPQTVSSGSKLFKITIAGADYYYSTPKDVVFKSANSYNYELTITQTGISVSSTITNWVSNEPITGEGLSED